MPVDPDVGTLSLGYAVHDIVKALLDKAATTIVDWSSAMVIGPARGGEGPDGDAASWGSRRRGPSSAPWLGMGTSKAIDPVEACVGVAP